MRVIFRCHLMSPQSYIQAQKRKRCVQVSQWERSTKPRQAGGCSASDGTGQVCQLHVHHRGLLASSDRTSIEDPFCSYRILGTPSAPLKQWPRRPKDSTIFELSSRVIVYEREEVESHLQFQTYTSHLTVLPQSVRTCLKCPECNTEQG